MRYLTTLSTILVWVLTTAAISYEDWDHLWLRAPMLLCASLVFALPARQPASRLLLIGLVVVAVALVFYQTPWREAEAAECPLLDVATTTLAATHVQAEGLSIYATAVDMGAPHGSGWSFFRGLKYGPLSVFFFRPFLALLGEPRGLLVGNLVLLLLTALAAAFIAKERGGVDAALGAAGLTLATPVVVTQALRYGAIDLAAVAPAVLAVWLSLRRHWFLAGVALGVSIAAKTLPGGLIAVAVLSSMRSPRLIAGMVVGSIPLLAEIVRTPKEAIANLVLFNVQRPPDSTSLVNLLPPELQSVFVLASVVCLAAICWSLAHGNNDPDTLVTAIVCLIAVFLFGSKIVHANYFLWWVPFAAVLLSRRFAEKQV